MAGENSGYTCYIFLHPGLPLKAPALPSAAHFGSVALLSAAIDLTALSKCSSIRSSRFSCSLKLSSILRLDSAFNLREHHLSARNRPRRVRRRSCSSLCETFVESDMPRIEDRELESKRGSGEEEVHCRAAERGDKDEQERRAVSSRTRSDSPP